MGPLSSELVGAQDVHIADALDAPEVMSSMKCWIAEDGEAFLEAELEPVAAGDAVAGPVVEVLVGHDAHDALEITVRGRLGFREHILGVEDVESLFSMAPMLKSSVATIMKRSRSYSLP